MPTHRDAQPPSPRAALAKLGAGNAASPIRFAYNEAASLGNGVTAQNQLTSVTWQDGNLRRYHHDSAASALHPRLLTGITDEAGVRYASFGYHPGGKIAWSEHIGGADRIELDYGAANGTAPGPDFASVAVKDYPAGSAQTRSYGFTTIGNARYPASLSAPCALCGNTQAAWSYDAAGRLGKSIGHDGKVTFNTYDALGRETERAVFPPSFAAETTRPVLNLAESVVSTAWHASFNVPTKRTEPAKLTTWTYEVDGMPASHVVATTSDATGAQGLDVPASQVAQTGASGWTYDARRLPATASESRPAATALALSLSYAANGDLAQIRDTATAKTLTITATDVHGSPTAWTDGDGVAHSSAFSVRRQLLEEVHGTKRRQLRYNAWGEPTEVRGFNRNKQDFSALYSFDTAHNLTRMTINGQVVSAPTSSGTAVQSLTTTTQRRASPAATRRPTCRVAASTMRWPSRPSALTTASRRECAGTTIRLGGAWRRRTGGSASAP